MESWLHDRCCSRSPLRASPILIFTVTLTVPDRQCHYPCSTDKHIRAWGDQHKFLPKWPSECTCLSLSSIQTKYHIPKSPWESRKLSPIEQKWDGWGLKEKQIQESCRTGGSILHMPEIQKWVEIQGVGRRDCRWGNKPGDLPGNFTTSRFSHCYPVTLRSQGRSMVLTPEMQAAQESPEGHAGATPERPPPGPSCQALSTAWTWHLPVNKGATRRHKEKDPRQPRIAKDTKGTSTQGLRIKKRH